MRRRAPALRGIQKADGTLTEFFFTRECDWDSEISTPLPASEPEEAGLDEQSDDEQSCPF